MSVDLIGLCGLSQAGKTTAAEAIVKEFSWEKRSFADPIKDLLYELNPCPVSFSQFPLRLQDMVNSQGWDRTKSIPDVRRMLQVLGVGVRAGAPDYWVRLLFTEPFPVQVVIDDVRFPNEVREIKARGGVVICVDRPGIDQMDHISERGVAHDILLDNSGGIMEFRKRVAETVRPMLEGS